AGEDPGAPRRGDDRGDHPPGTGAADRGLKEKTLAAHRAGMKTVLIPRENRKDLRDIPKKIRDQLRIVPVEYVDDVLREALLLEKPEEFFRKSSAAEAEPGPPAP